MAPKFAVDIHADAADLLSLPINISSSGNNSIVFGVAGQLIRVYKIWFITTSATTVQFQDGTSTVMAGPASFAANQGFVLDFDTKPWYTTSQGNDFVINLGTGVQVGGSIHYTQA